MPSPVHNEQSLDITISAALSRHKPLLSLILRLNLGWFCALHAAIGIPIHRLLRVKYLAFARSQPYIHRMESSEKTYIW